VLKPGKIYTYYVVACYDTGGTRYTTINPKSSTVVWGVPQLSEEALESLKNDGNIYAASIFGTGSLGMVIAILALGVSVASIGMNLSNKNKKASEETESDD
jgi:hypothetical protein